VCPMAAYLAGQGMLQHVINDKGGETAKSASPVVWIHREVLSSAKAPQPSASRWPTTSSQLPVPRMSLPQSTSRLTSTLVPRKPADGSDCAEGWGKCGGDTWKGSTCCVSGFACVEQNLWYSLCIPERSVPQPSQVRSSGTSTTVLVSSDVSAKVLTTSGTTDSRAWGKMLMGRQPPQHHSEAQEKQHPAPRSEASFSIPWWAWLSLTMQTCAICGLGVFVWQLSAMAKRCLNGANQVELEPQPGDEVVGIESISIATPRIQAASSRLILVHSAPPTMTIPTVLAYSPETTRSMRSLMVTSPVSPDEA